MLLRVMVYVLCVDVVLYITCGYVYSYIIIGGTECVLKCIKHC